MPKISTLNVMLLHPEDIRKNVELSVTVPPAAVPGLDAFNGSPFTSGVLNRMLAVLGSAPNAQGKATLETLRDHADKGLRLSVVHKVGRPRS